MNRLQDRGFGLVQRRDHPVLLAFTLAVAMLVFLVDTQLPFGVAIAFGYVPLILVVLKWGGPRQYWWLALTASALIVLGYFITPPEPVLQWIEVHNRVLSIAAIWTAAVVGSLLWGVRFRLAEQHERYSRTLASIGDGVVATDAAGRVTFMNPVAERLTGWSLAEARQRHMREIFHVVAEASRQPARNPAEEVLRTGELVRAANHALLIARNGAEYPIDDSGAPIRDAAGHLIGTVLVFRDMSAKRQAEAALKRSLAESESRAAELSAVFNALTQPVIVFDDLGKPVKSNRAAREILGADPCELNANSYVQLSNIFRARRLDGKPLQAGELPSRRALVGETVQGELVMLTNAAGQDVILETAGIPLRVGGQLVGAVAVWRDVTERRRAEQQREQLLASERAARSEAERANRVKDEFVATLSHELRTPLNAIMGWAQILRRGKLDVQDTTEAVQIIQSNAQAQKQLIDDLLDVSRMMAGKIRLELRPLDLAQAASAALASVQPAAQNKGLRLEAAIAADAGRILGDAERMQQVLWNLLSNAVKFTPTGGSVRFAVQRNCAKAIITVADTGIGIQPEFLPSVFERFRQADGSTTRRYRGLGLGLSIVKQLVELHGGSVTAASPGENQGATFTVELPLAAELEAAIAGAPPQVVAAGGDGPGAAQPRLDGVRVLVVDDLADARELLARLFREHAATVATADSAAAALQQIRSAAPDVLVSDIGMPDEDGYSLIHKVRNWPNPAVAGIPAIAVTAFARPEDRKQALQAGYQAHVSKPVDPAELIALVSELAGRSAAGAADLGARAIHV